jgi:hypothetical protein
MRACAFLVIDASTMGMYMVLTTIVVIIVGDQGDLGVWLSVTRMLYFGCGQSGYTR